MSNVKKIAKPTEIEGIVNEIAAERLSQVATWGVQDHPSTYSDLDRKRAEKHANHWKQVNSARVANDTLTWDGILLEEVYEALAEKDPFLRRAELVQVAAVAAAEIESIDRWADQAPEPDAEPLVRSCPMSVEGCEFECEDGPCAIEADAPIGA